MRVKSVAVLVALASFASGVASADARGRADDSALKLKKFACMSDCLAGGAVSVGSELELAGKNLAGVVKVKFVAAGGGRVSAEPTGAEAEFVQVVVPEGAATGTVKVKDDQGNKATSRRELKIGESTSDSEDPGGSEAVDPTNPGSPDQATSGAIKIDRDKGFFKSRRQVSAALGGGETSVEVVAASDDTVVATLEAEAGSVSWGGLTDDGQVAPNGEYRFRLASGGSSDTFEQYDHIFPVRGKHSYGDGLGAGRGHSGQDVLADCGKKVRAARAGRVVSAGNEGDMGNYLVIEGKKEATTYVYMHLQDGGTVAEGEKVKTGQAIGNVGDTGNATTCHLHFEMWDGAWQEGKLLDPAPELKKWDDWS